MAEPAKRPYPADHPVLSDVELRERVLDIMWFRIQKTISPTRPPMRRSASTADLQLAGGIRADMVLNAALNGVLRFEPANLTGSWEGLATTIAHRQAVQAVRDNTKGRLTTKGEANIRSIDQVDDDGETLGVRLADRLADDLADPEGEAVALAQERIVQRLARQLLNERDRDIFFRRHYRNQLLGEIANLHDLTEAGARYVYIQAAKTVLSAARQDPDFQRMSDPDRGGDR